MNDRERPSRAPAIITGLAVLLFLAYAFTFLYFFVDDEAITMVYAQNLLRGMGLSYNAIEGPTEGYSNFLHVVVSAVLLGLTKVLGLPKVAVFALGMAVSICSGALIIVMAGQTLTRLAAGDWPAQSGALGFLALAGPLAVWSCSSLETVPVAAAFTGFVIALLFGAPGRLRWPVVIGAVLLLYRIDGFLYAGLAWTAAFLVASPARRADLIRIGVMLAGLCVAYNGWRWWYFGSLLSLPLQTKVLFKLLPAEGVVTELPAETYLARFLGAYHLLPLMLIAFGWMPFWRRGDDRRPFALLAIALGAASYAAVVGDWMFGFRLFVGAFPVLALLAGASLAALRRQAPRLGLAAAGLLVVWSGYTAERFAVSFEAADRLAGWQWWWREPSFQAGRFFQPYYSLYRDLKDGVAPGTVTVNNQAGFLPFMLDLSNIDDLGIASRFFATLPTADVVFTEVGRYHPLGDRPPLSAGELYLAQSPARYLIVWAHMLLNRHDGHIPETLLGGHFRVAHKSAHQVVYERARAPETPELDDFHENLAHPANLEFVAVQGRAVSRSQLRARLPFLVGESAHFATADPLGVEMHLKRDPVHALWIDHIQSDVEARVTVVIRDGGGRQVFRDEIALAPHAPMRYHRALDQAVEGATVTLTLARSGSASGSLVIRDLRVLGQPLDLREQVEKELAGRF